MQTRRDFLRAGAAFGISYALGACRMQKNAGIDSDGQAEMIVLNGRIATQDERRSCASAAAIKDGRFIAVGSEQDVLAHSGGNSKVIDLKGKTAIPGLNDSHTHIIRGGLNYNMEL